MFYGNFSVSYSSETHHAKSLEALGHEVIRLQEPRVAASDLLKEAALADLFVWVKTHSWDTPGIEEVLESLRERRIPIITYHLDLYMGLQRWTEYKNDPYMRGLDHFFTVDRLMADWLNANTPVRGHYLPPGVFGEECYITDYVDRHDFANDIIFVGQYHYHPEWPYRPQLIDWLGQTYGDRFTRIAGDTLAGTVRGHDLNRLYGSSNVVVGDSLCPNFDYPDYWSDRVTETLGRGGFLIMPYIKGLERSFRDGEHLRYYEFGNFTQLRELIDFYSTHGAEREQIRRAGHELVKAKHTYANRWQQILETIA